VFSHSKPVNIAFIADSAVGMEHDQYMLPFKGWVALRPLIGPQRYATRHTYSESASHFEYSRYLRTLKYGKKRIFGITTSDGGIIGPTKNIFFPN
jgi:hypothetical protein